MNEKKPQTKQINTPDEADEKAKSMPKEVGGSDKPEPTRYGDWEVDGRCSDF